MLVHRYSGCAVECGSCQTLGGCHFLVTASHFQVCWFTHPGTLLLPVALFVAIKPQAESSAFSLRLRKACPFHQPLAKFNGADRGRSVNVRAPAATHLHRSARADRGRSANGLPKTASLKSVKPHAPSSARAARPSAVSARPALWQLSICKPSTSSMHRVRARAATARLSHQTFRFPCPSLCLKIHGNSFAALCLFRIQTTCTTSRLTLPSRGRFPAYGLQAPLMSNVRRLENREHLH